MNSPRSSTESLIAALRVLARDIHSDDGIANAAIAEAADRLYELDLCVEGIIRAKPGGVSPALAPFSRAEILGWIGDNYTLEEIKQYYAKRGR
jgi:hypothetical protein